MFLFTCDAEQAFIEKLYPEINNIYVGTVFWGSVTVTAL